MSTTFDASDKLGNALSLACCALKRGKQGPDQPSSVRGHLVQLVDLGLATWTEKTGWRLTDAGRERSRDFLRACRSARRKSS